MRELARWLWRQLTSMRTALILLLLLALAAIPGSVIPQSDVDSLKTSNWQADHPKLTPIYEKLQLFSVYDSAWFSAIYILLVISLVGCIVPRTWVYARAIRAQPPAAPRNLTRLPDHATWTTSAEPDEVLEAAAVVLKKRRYRVVTGSPGAVSAEKGYLREVGNLIFHLAVLVVLVGFAVGGLFGYKGGVIVLEHGGFSNNLTQYDDFDPGSLFDPGNMEPFSFDIVDFDAKWLPNGPRAGMAYDFVSHLNYQESPTSPEKSYDLKVNHPLKIGGTEVFLIGHGYAPSSRSPTAMEIAFHRARGLPAGGPVLPVLRRGQGCRGLAHPDRPGGRVLPDVRLHSGDRSLLRLRQRAEPAGLTAGLRRRPRARLR